MISLRPVRLLAVLLLALLAMLWSVPSRASSPLIDLQSGRGLYHDVKALEVGDLVTILIVEAASADTRATTDTNNKTEIQGGPGLGLLDLVTDWGLDSENKYKGDGKSTRAGNLTARISARVVEKLDNGLLRVEGTRVVEINSERQTLTLAGLIRTRDLSAHNTIESTFIADAEIRYSGKGTISRAHEPGIFTRIVNWIF